MARGAAVRGPGPPVVEQVAQRALEGDPRLPAGGRAQARRVADLRGHVGGAQPLGIHPHLDAGARGREEHLEQLAERGRPVPLHTL